MSESTPSIHERVFMELSDSWLSAFTKIGRTEAPKRATDLDSLAAMLIAVEFPDRLSLSAHKRAVKCSLLAANRILPWVDQLPWSIARDCLSDALGIEGQWQNGFEIAASALDEPNSALRIWAMEIAWFIRLRIPREEAVQKLFENAASTQAYTTNAWGFAAALFAKKGSFYQEAENYQPEDYQEQYVERKAFYQKIYPANWQAHFWKLEAELRWLIQVTMQRLDPEALPKGGHLQGDEVAAYSKPIPSDRFDKMMNAAKTLINAGINTPEALSAAMNERFNGRLNQYTQSLWNLIVAFDHTGEAAKTLVPDWSMLFAEENDESLTPTIFQEIASSEHLATEWGRRMFPLTEEEYESLIFRVRKLLEGLGLNSRVVGCYLQALPLLLENQAIASFARRTQRLSVTNIYPNVGGGVKTS